jgi:serine/threonine protein kinase
VPKNGFKYFQDMFWDLRKSPYVRVADDASPDQSMFAYKYLKDHLLSFAQKDIPLPLIKRILTDSLQGIAALHGKGIVHTDIKPNNIMVDWDETDGDTTISRSRLPTLKMLRMSQTVVPSLEGRLGIGCGEVPRLMHLVRFTNHQTSSLLALS